jgi:hypothetical protein
VPCGHSPGRHRRSKQTAATSTIVDLQEIDARIASIEDAVMMMNRNEGILLTFASLPETASNLRDEARVAELAVIGPVILLPGAITAYHPVGVFVHMRGFLCLVVASLRNVSGYSKFHSLFGLHRRDKLCCSMKICIGCQHGPEVDLTEQALVPEPSIRFCIVRATTASR